ncbi:GNAT family N-acetyltransferase [Limnobaculum parvum]|uniref:GNAT family N-acetyltransferase n=1 Tax=Limnobaculum parvum TaxID=2172103 RepID=A0A2Y9TXQ2_9GAMM|nr:GNAT family N-acetyltransferase [Limnobaculum parvum]AWH88320.1 GNAT family N-acetyltransferase [Limnobaculum parvum]
MDANVQSDPELVIIPISDIHRCSTFKTGDAQYQPLKTFLQQDSIDFKNNFIAQTYVVIDDNERTDKNKEPITFPYSIIGYITLTCSEIDIDYDFGECERAKRYTPYPAIKIARLAVDSRYRGQGIGSLLLEYALYLVKDAIMPKVGCRFLITDAKQNAISFYARYDMQLVDTEENKSSEHPIMFIDLYKTAHYSSGENKVSQSEAILAN